MSPVTPNAYYGMQKKTASDAVIPCINSFAVACISLLSLKAGIASISVNILRSTSSGAKQTTLSTALADEFGRRLPEIARILILSSFIFLMRWVF